MPGLAHLFTDGIVTILELIKHEGVQLRGINLPLFIQNRFIRKNSHDFTDHVMTVDLHLVFNDPAFKGQRELLNDRSIHFPAFHCGQPAALKFVGHFVCRGNAKEIGRFHMRNIRNAEGESAAFSDILGCLMILADVERHHILRTDAAPCHIHHIHSIVVAVGGDHQHGHRKQIRMDPQFFFHGNDLRSCFKIDFMPPSSYHYSGFEKESKYC